MFLCFNHFSSRGNMFDNAKQITSFWKCRYIKNLIFFPILWTIIIFNGRRFFLVFGRHLFHVFGRKFFLVLFRICFLVFGMFGLFITTRMISIASFWSFTMRFSVLFWKNRILFQWRNIVFRCAQHVRYIIPRMFVLCCYTNWLLLLTCWWTWVSIQGTIITRILLCNMNFSGAVI